MSLPRGFSVRYPRTLNPEGRPLITLHQLPLQRRTVHGPFDRERPPVLTIDAGDTVVFQTLDSGWHWESGEREDAGRGFERDLELDTGHALSGPIYVRGAAPGDVLAIEIGEVRPRPWGWTWAGPAPWMDHWQRMADTEVVVRWQIDLDACTATDLNGLGITLPIRPFMGVMGNAPGEPGAHETRPPRPVGGNIDCKELVAGSTLWLPVEVEGALFSVGDGHATQGDGEVSCTAIECPMERVELTFRLRKDMSLASPHAQTPSGYVVMGLGDDLDHAMWSALSGMLQHMQETYGLPRPEALALASLVVDMRVTQVVNGTLGCHAVLSSDAFVRSS